MPGKGKNALSVASPAGCRWNNALHVIRAVLHAKCVVIDGRIAFVSSANFTEAAQERNIEVGVLVRSELIAERIINFFTALISTGAVRRAL